MMSGHESARMSGHGPGSGSGSGSDGHGGGVKDEIAVVS